MKALVFALKLIGFIALAFAIVALFAFLAVLVFLGWYHGELDQLEHEAERELMEALP